ncbi:MAG: Lrp/AsnC ligand binding domain-containing protein [Candidatus Omnitrophica bacterium]|nr:Lrp/AsnC ligand binding domain-containing protein [Candidatus Omnitrophota bacterium]
MNPGSKAKHKLSALDKRILNRLGEDIPFGKKPWEIIARELKIKEEALLKRLALLKQKGIIRRISATFSPRKIDFTSTLVGVKASPKWMTSVIKKINSYPEVTHNYRRESVYNLWFTLVARNRKRIDRVLREIGRVKGIEKLSEFPAIKTFKIKVKFTL